MTKRRSFQGIVPKWLVRVDGRYEINGRSLNDYGLFVGAAGLVVGEAEPSITYRDVPGMDGDNDVAFTNRDGAAYLPRRTVTLSVGCIGLESDYIHSQLELASLSGKIVQLRDNMQPGYWTGRLTIGEWEVERNQNGVFVQASNTLSIEAMPYMLGPVETKTWLAGGGQTLNVRGNRLTWPVFVLKPASSTENIELTCRDAGESTDDRRLTLVKPSNGWGSVTITVDMERGVTTIGDNNPFYDIDMTSNYWPLSPGMQQVGIVNATGTMEVTPRWIV